MESINAKRERATRLYQQKKEALTLAFDIRDGQRLDDIPLYRQLSEKIYNEYVQTLNSLVDELAILRT